MLPNKTARLSAGRSLSSCNSITEPERAQVLGQAQEPGPERVQGPAPVQEPGRARVQELGRAQVLQAPELVCWRQGARQEPGHARRRFYQRHNTQPRPG